MRGLEPPRCHHHRLLRPARLPVPPHPRDTSRLYEPGPTVSSKRQEMAAILFLARVSARRSHVPNLSIRLLSPVFYCLPKEHAESEVVPMAPVQIPVVAWIIR